MTRKRLCIYILTLKNSWLLSIAHSITQGVSATCAKLSIFLLSRLPWVDREVTKCYPTRPFRDPFTARNDNRKLPGWSGHNRGDIFWCSSSFFLVHTSREIVFDVLLPSSSSTFLNSDVHIVFFRGDSSCCLLKRTRWRRVRTLALERRDPNT